MTDWFKAALRVVAIAIIVATILWWCFDEPYWYLLGVALIGSGLGKLLVEWWDRRR